MALSAVETGNVLEVELGSSEESRVANLGRSCTLYGCDLWRLSG